MFFETKRTTYLPGYTGHVPHNYYEEVEQPEPGPPRAQIPGYAGYIPSVQAENLYGTTYGKISYSSATKNFPKGRDHVPAHKYKTAYQDQYINLSTVQEPKAADVLGVTRKQDTPTVVVPVTTANAFWGVEDEEAELRESKRAFFDNPAQHQQEEGKAQSPEAAKTVFYGMNPEPTEPQKLGEPVPGYTGFSRKVTACNIFGLTYAQARKSASERLEEQRQEKAEVLHTRAQFVPEYLK